RAGELVTLRLPSRARTTVTDTGAGANAAPTVVAAASVSVHAPVPEHPPPDHPVNTEPAAAVAESVTLVPAVNVAEHVAPQVIPAGELVTGPLPGRVTLRVTGGAPAGKAEAPLSKGEARGRSGASSAAGPLGGG